MSVLVGQHGAVLTVTIDRPERHNVLDGETMGAIGRAFSAAEIDDGVRALVLTASGDTSFCAGLDLRAFAALGAPPRPTEGPGLEVLLTRGFPKPVVAAVNGRALGVGFELILACDLVVAADHATFALPEVRRGLVAAGGGISELPSRVPLGVALELGLTGATMDAARAHALGLVNRVVPARDVIAEADRFATAIAANAPLAVRFTKRHMRNASTAGPDHRELLRHELAQVLSSDDAREGSIAFAERRPPAWTGR
ncbi:enoyl-CoA hydratase-related protein [Gordonia sp. CPCC 206044]|uniref:enoyl-CoA hydratase/isomerase family protein n=1 Tax=Gordonia sp. CPCC 206044 TaxID=3140793 RepID=UPI003AF3CD4E